MLQLGSWDSYNSASTASNNVAIGCAISTSKRWALCVASVGAATMNTRAYHVDTKCSVALSNTGAVDYEADFVSFDADGYTMNWTNPDSTATDAIPTLLIKGGHGTLARLFNGIIRVVRQSQLLE